MTLNTSSINEVSFSNFNLYLNIWVFLLKNGCIFCDVFLKWILAASSFFAQKLEVEGRRIGERERTERKYFPSGPLQHEVEFIIKIFHDLHQ